jgi:2-oxoglutarate dehydrogenase E2 component (dihydrolipoamide succinyltransferase)
MPFELKVPEVGESITEVQIGKWHKGEGQHVEKDEPVVEIESDKATVDLPAPAAGTISQMLKQQGDQATVGEVIGYLQASNEAPAGKKPQEPTPPKSAAAKQPATTSEPQVVVEKKRGETAIGPVQSTAGGGNPPPRSDGAAPFIMPAARRALAKHGLSADQVQATGPGGRMLQEDVERAAAREAKTAGQRAPAAVPTPEKPLSLAAPRAERPAPRRRGTEDEREDEFVPMSPIRRRIAERLVEAQQTGALLTTYNEVDMSEVIALRQKHKDAYLERYGVKLGFMSFFVKAVVDALKLIPQVNAEIRDPHIVFHRYYDIGIAVGGGKGLVVPVLRNAEQMSFGEIELAVADFARRAAENKLALDELQGGTFTISNGGVYGSLLSTPIVNPPQSGILGLHAIQDRPVARGDQVVIRPMMYIALTYDHRLVDGREAVMFLKRVKETIEDPARLFLEV